MPAFNLTATLNKTTLPTNYDATVFLLVKVEPTKEAEEAVKIRPRKVHIVFTIDNSGSMAGEKLDAAKEAIIRRFRKDLGEEDMLSLVTFSDTAEVILQSVSRKTTTDFESKVRGIGVGSLTNLYDGLVKSIDILKNTPAEYLRRVVLVTDGQPTTGVTDHDKIVKLVKEAKERYNIRFDVYGIGSDYDYELCQRIADAGGGWMRHVEKAVDVEKTTKTSTETYKRTIVDTTILSVSLANNVKLEDVVMALPEIKRLDVSAMQWDCGSLSAGKPIVVVMKLLVGKGFPPGTHKIAEVKVGITKVEVTANFVTDMSFIQENVIQPRLYYLVASTIANMREKAGKELPTSEEERFLNEIISKKEVKDLALNDPYFAVIVASYTSGKTIVDQRTKIDRVTHPMD